MNAFGKFGLILVLGIALSLILSIPVWLLWNNSLVGAINGVNPIAWIDAWGISILTSCLFKDSSVKFGE